MKRRDLLFSGTALLAHFAIAPNVPASEEGCRPFRPWGTPPIFPFPFSPFSTGIHNMPPELGRNLLAFSQTDLDSLARGTTMPLVISSGPTAPRRPSGWTTETAFHEDIAVWVKSGSQIDDISLDNLKRRVRDSNEVFFNIEDFKFQPVRNWLSQYGFEIPERNDLMENGLGGQGYEELIDVASKVADPIVFGMRSFKPEGFRPLAIDGKLPSISECYPLRKPVFIHYRDQNAANSFWNTTIIERFSEQIEMDVHIYETLGANIHDALRLPEMR